mmetsp:Transcript_34782/g.111128  ORF Transcript_34782/g.111128 Transcript_34782/m.111128 type:complete len:207 (-) Transcript_34782:811-1431(-)
MPVLRAARREARRRGPPMLGNAVRRLLLRQPPHALRLWGVRRAGLAPPLVAPLLGSRRQPRSPPGPSSGCNRHLHRRSRVVEAFVVPRLVSTGARSCAVGVHALVAGAGLVVQLQPQPLRRQVLVRGSGKGGGRGGGKGSGKGGGRGRSGGGRGGGPAPVSLVCGRVVLARLPALPPPLGQRQGEEGGGRGGGDAVIRRRRRRRAR